MKILLLSEKDIYINHRNVRGTENIVKIISNELQIKGIYAHVLIAKENREINTDLEILIYDQNKSTNFIELSVAKIMDYFNINSSYGDRLKNNLSLMNIGGLLSIWQHPS